MNTSKDGITARSAGGPRQWMQDHVRRWLATPAWRPDDLEAWLSGGGDLPPVGGDSEPYVLLLRGIPEGNRRPAAVDEFAKRVAVVLANRPDLREPTPDQLVYNLFRLCVGLAHPDYLAEPLYAMVEGNRKLGRYGRNDLRVALRAALVHNQIDDHLWPIWESMLRGQDTELPGVVRDGFEGVAHMPESLEHRSRPDLDKIGLATERMIAYLDRDDDRDRKFLDLLDSLRTIWLRPWQAGFRVLADKYAWPKWASALLPADAFAASAPVSTITIPERSCYFLLAGELAKMPSPPDGMNAGKILRTFQAAVESNVRDARTVRPDLPSIELHTLVQQGAEYEWIGYGCIEKLFEGVRRQIYEGAGLLAKPVAA